MITDESVVQFFRNLPDAPVDFMGSKSEVQIVRGISPNLWKDAPPGGCKRHMLMFEKTGAIPKYCFDCYKVSIAPRNVVELFKLFLLFEKIALPFDNTRKCMVEGRNYCSGAYKGFVYCRGIEAGNEVRKIVRKVVSDEISPQVPVTLKRGCSEYAQKYPRYAQMKPGTAIMQYKKDWKILEDSFDTSFVFQFPETNSCRPTTYAPHEIYCMKNWLRYAASIGDRSYLAIAGMTMQPLPNLKRPPFGITAPRIKNKGMLE